MKKLKNLKDVIILSKKEQKSISGGNFPCYNSGDCPNLGIPKTCKVDYPGAQGICVYANV